MLSSFQIRPICLCGFPCLLGMCRCSLHVCDAKNVDRQVEHHNPNKGGIRYASKMKLNFTTVALLLNPKHKVHNTFIVTPITTTPMNIHNPW